MNQEKNKDKHWLVRKTTIRKLWIILYLSLIISVLVELLVTHHERFGGHGIDSSFGFSAWFGFVSCVLMVFFAKLLGFLVKRPDNYYIDKPQNNLEQTKSNGRHNA